MPLCPRDGARIEAMETDPLVGRTLVDRYRVECLVGEGAMGRVYRARHATLSRRFAVKILFGDLAAHDVMRARFAREAEAASRLEHPNLVSVVDFGETETGLLYLAMQYVEGPTLHRLVSTEGPLDELRVVRLALGLCHGLSHAHGRGLVHRDFKPENVIVETGSEELARVVDFGIAQLDGGSAASAKLTHTGMILGTPLYMSPEQATSADVDARADLYSLGSTLFFALTGMTPFTGNTIQVLSRIVATPAPPVGSLAPHPLTPELEDLVARLLAKLPAERPPSADAVAAELARILPIVAERTVRGHAVPVPRVVVEPPTRVTAPPERPEAVSRPRPGSTLKPPLPSSGPRVAVAFAVALFAGMALAVAVQWGIEPELSPQALEPVPSAARAGGPPPMVERAPVVSAETQAPEPVAAAEASETAALEPAAIAPIDPPPAPVEPASPASDPPASPPEAAVVPSDPRGRRPSAAPTTRRRPTRRRETAPASPPRVAAPTPSPPGSAPADAPTPEAIAALYREVGGRLEALARERGKDVAAPLERAYLEIPFAKALVGRDEDRISARAALIQLRGRIRAAARAR